MKKEDRDLGERDRLDSQDADPREVNYFQTPEVSSRSLENSVPLKHDGDVHAAQSGSAAALRSELHRGARDTVMPDVAAEHVLLLRRMGQPTKSSRAARPVACATFMRSLRPRTIVRCLLCGTRRRAVAHADKLRRA